MNATRQRCTGISMLRLEHLTSAEAAHRVYTRDPFARSITCFYDGDSESSQSTYVSANAHKKRYIAIKGL